MLYQEMPRDKNHAEVICSRDVCVSNGNASVVRYFSIVSFSQDRRKVPTTLLQCQYQVLGRFRVDHTFGRLGHRIIEDCGYLVGSAQRECSINDIGTVTDLVADVAGVSWSKGGCTARPAQYGVANNVEYSYTLGSAEPVTTESASLTLTHDQTYFPRHTWLAEIRGTNACTARTCGVLECLQPWRRHPGT